MRGSARAPAPLAGEIEALLAFEGEGLPVSSLYLTLDRARDPQRGYTAVLKDLIREAERRATAAGLGEEARRALAADWEAMRQAVAGSRGFAPRALAVFACGREGFWHLLHLPGRVPNRLDFGSRPYVGPLVRLRAENGSGLVLLVGRDRGRLLRLSEGRLVEEERWQADVPQRVREAGWMSWSEKRIDHHVLDHLHRHLKEAAARLAARFRSDGDGWVIVGGSDEPRALLERHLPQDVRSCLLGWLGVPVEAAAGEVLARVRELERSARRERLARLFARLEEGAASGWGTLGFGDTAVAAARGALAVLLIAADARVPGRRCRACGLPVPEAAWAAVPRCPGCGGQEAAAVGDVHEELICDALRVGAEVLPVDEGGSAAWRAAGGVGGLLRF